MLSVMVFAFYFQVLMRSQIITIGVQSFAFAPLQSVRAMPWQAYVPPGVGLWSIKACTEELLFLLI